MARLHIFADEAGDFEFSRKQNVSRYFILCTVAMDSCHVADDLLNLRRQLAWDGFNLGDYFHATVDKQLVRDEVFNLITNHDFSVQATIMEKSKAQTQVRTSRARFYQYGWLYHFRHSTRSLLNGMPELMVTTASIGTKKERASFASAVKDAMRQTINPGFPRWITSLMTCFGDSAIRINAIPSALRANPMSPGG